MSERLNEFQIRILIAIANIDKPKEIDIRKRLKKKDSILQSLKVLKKRKFLTQTNDIWSLSSKGQKRMKEESLLIEKSEFTRREHSRREFEREAHTRGSHERTITELDGTKRKIEISEAEIPKSTLPQTTIPETKVPATSFRIRDLGGKGRGQVVIPPEQLKKDINLFNTIARDRGFIQQNETIGDIPNKDMKRYARVVVEELQKKFSRAKDPLDKAVDKANGFFNYMANVLRKRQELKGFKLKMEIARKEIVAKFPKQVKPIEAIAKWRDLTPQVRKQLAPSRKNNPDFELKEIVVKRNGKTFTRKQWVKKKK